MCRVRALAVLAIVAALSLPVAAAPRQKERTPKENPIVKIIRQIAVRTFGDGLIEPKP